MVGFESFVVRVRKVLFFSLFSKFLSLISFFRVGVKIRIRFRFEPSSPIARELILSLTRLSFPLVRFRHNVDHDPNSSLRHALSHENAELQAQL